MVEQTTVSIMGKWKTGPREAVEPKFLESPVLW